MDVLTLINLPTPVSSLLSKLLNQPSKDMRISWPGVIKLELLIHNISKMSKYENTFEKSQHLLNIQGGLLGVDLNICSEKNHQNKQPAMPGKNLKDPT